jgi:hypothetical protein
MDRDVFIWFGLALVAAVAATPALLAGGFPLLPLFLASFGLTCAIHGGSRALVIDASLRLLSGGALRTTLVVLGGLMLIQLLPIELALLMAGDVLAYVEVLAAVSLIAANARVRVLRATLVQKVNRWRTMMHRRMGRGAPRSVRPATRRRPPPADHDPAQTWAFA